MQKTPLNTVFTRKNPHYEVSITLKRPIIGIGAPIAYFLPRAVIPLGGRAILPEDADVANAIGAITSHVAIKKWVRILPGEGNFRVEGLAGNHEFKAFDDADTFARKELVRMVRERATAAGTTCQTIQLETHDQMTETAGGEAVFMGRTLSASLVGRPDRVLNDH